MHSFASTLIAATLATLSSAAPIALPANLPGVPAVPAALPPTIPSVPLLGASSLGQLGSVEGQVKSVANTVHLRDVDSKISDAVKSIESGTSKVHAREDTPCVAGIFNDVLTEIKPYTEQLTFLDSSNITVTEVTSIVASIKASIVEAVPKLQVLVGVNASVILAPLTGDVELTVPEIATIVSGELELVLGAAGHVITVVDAEGGDIVVDVKAVLVDLGNTVTGLVGAVLPLVDGLATSLVPLLAPVDSVISDLGLVSLTALLGVTL